MTRPPDKPTVLHAAELEPNTEVVETMRYWLAEAKSGNLRGVILLGVTTKGNHIRSSKGEMGDANAVYLATLTIDDAIRDAQCREHPYELPTLKPDPEEDGNDIPE